MMFSLNSSCIDEIPQMLILSIFLQMPSYKNFTGQIVQTEPTRFVSRGTIEVIDNKTLEITELPIQSWTQTYKESVLEPMLHGTEKIQPCIL